MEIKGLGLADKRIVSVGMLVCLATFGIALGYPPDWDSLDEAGLAALAKGIAKEQRPLLAKYLAQKYLGEKSKTQSVAAASWRSFCESLGGDMSDTTGQTWKTALGSAFVEDAAKLNALNANESVELAVGMGCLGDNDAKDSLMTAAGGKTTSYGSLTVPNLSVLASHVFWTGLEGRPTLKNLGQHVLTAHLADGQKVRAVPAKYWPELANHIGIAQDYPTQKQWSQKLYDAYMETVEIVRNLAEKDAAKVAKAMEFLGQREQAGALAVKWLIDNHTTWQQEAVRDLSALAVYAGYSGQVAAKTALAELDAKWKTEHQANPFNAWICKNICGAWSNAGDSAKAKAWALAAHEVVAGSQQARESSRLVDLEFAVRSLAKTGQLGAGKDYPLLAAALVIHAQNAPLWKGEFERDYFARVPRQMGEALRTAASRDALEAILKDAEGQVRWGVARVLTWSYSAAGRLKAWKASLDQELAGPGLAGDKKARWLLVRGYAESVRGRSFVAAAGRQWMDQALATATSNDLRIRILAEVLRGYIDGRDFTEASTLLESLEPQFEQTNAKDLADLRAIIKKEQARYVYLRLQRQAMDAERRAAH